jgi:hypothetical protein
VPRGLRRRRARSRGPRPQTDGGAHADGEGRVRRREQQRVSGGDEDERRDRDEVGAEAIGLPAAGDLHEGVREEERRGQEPHDAEAHAVGLGKRLRDRARVRDVPAHSGADQRAARHRAS